MGKQSKRRMRQQKNNKLASIASTAILISSAVVVAANIHASTYINDNDPAAAPSNNMHSHSSSHEEGNSSLIPPSTHKLSTVFSCGHTWRDASSTCSNLCPSGLDSSCPNGQSCYAGLTCSSPSSTIEINNGEEEGGNIMSYEIRSHSDALSHQSLIEQNLLSSIHSSNKHEYTNKFICSTSYQLATQQCNTQTSNLSSYKGSIMPLTYCNTNNACPHSQECYVVSCPKELHNDSGSKGVVELLTMENVGNWLVNKLTLFTPSSSQEDKDSGYANNRTTEDPLEEEDEEDRAVFSTWTSYFTEQSSVSSVLRLSLDMIPKN